MFVFSTKMVWTMETNVPPVNLGCLDFIGFIPRLKQKQHSTPEGWAKFLGAAGRESPGDSWHPLLDSSISFPSLPVSAVSFLHQGFLKALSDSVTLAAGTLTSPNRGQQRLGAVGINYRNYRAQTR